MERNCFLPQKIIFKLEVRSAQDNLFPNCLEEETTLLFKCIPINLGRLVLSPLTPAQLSKPSAARGCKASPLPQARLFAGTIPLNSLDLAEQQICPLYDFVHY